MILYIKIYQSEFKWIFCLIILTCISHVYTDFRQVNVTAAQCGRTFDIATEESLVLDYDGRDLGKNNGGLCVITVQNKNNDTVICIQTNTTRTRQCSSVFHYHVGNTSPEVHSIGYTCHDFYMHPLCARRTSVFAAFRSPIVPHIARVNVEIYLDNQTYYTTTTSSSLLSESETSNIIIGLVVGVVCVILLLILYVTCNRRKKMSDDQLGQSYTMNNREGGQSQRAVSTISQQYCLNTNSSEATNDQTSTQQGFCYVNHAADITLTGCDVTTTRHNKASAPTDAVCLNDPPPYPGY